MKTSSAKAKGRNLQKHVVARIHHWFPSLEEGDAKSCSMGSNGEDVQLSPAARRVLPVSIECKNKAAFAVYKDYAQAVANAKNYQPLLVIKQNRSEPLVLMNLDYYLCLMSQLQEPRV